MPRTPPQPWTCFFCQKRRPATAAKRSFTRKGETKFCCPSVDPKETTRIDCDHAYHYTLVFRSTDPSISTPIILSKRFTSLFNARHHGSIYSAYRLLDAYMTDFPVRVSIIQHEAFVAWATAQEWEEDREYRLERYFVGPQPGQSRRHHWIVWLPTIEQGVLVKTIWGEGQVVA